LTDWARYLYVKVCLECWRPIWSDIWVRDLFEVIFEWETYLTDAWVMIRERPPDGYTSMLWNFTQKLSLTIWVDEDLFEWFMSSDTWWDLLRSVETYLTCLIDEETYLSGWRPLWVIRPIWSDIWMIWPIWQIFDELAVVR
jgi:hypothetical protein